MEHPAPNFDAGIYYQQVLSLRDVLLDLKKHHACHRVLARHPIDDALRYTPSCRTAPIGLTRARPVTILKVSWIGSSSCYVATAFGGNGLMRTAGLTPKAQPELTLSAPKRNTMARCGWPTSSRWIRPRKHWPIWQMTSEKRRTRITPGPTPRRPSGSNIAQCVE